MNSEQISKIHIKGFKSIKDCHLNMKMVNVLIGTNGAGKSNFISVFKLLQDVIEMNMQLNVALAGGPSALLFNGMKETSELSVRFDFGNNGYEFTLMPTDEGAMVFKEEYFRYRYGGKDFGRRLGLRAGYAESQWERGTGTKYDSFVQPILEKQKWRLYHFHDTSRGARVKQNCSLANNLELLSDAGNLAAFLYRIKTEYPSNYANIIRTIQLVAPYFEDFYLEPLFDGENTNLRWRQKGSYDIFNANQLSDGTIRFICLVTLLKQPADLQPESIVIDEPELGLHPYALTILGEIIHATALRKQIIISTQSVELLNEFEVDEIVVVNRDDDGTKFERLNEEELFAWLETDYSLGDLWKKNVLGGRF